MITKNYFSAFSYAAKVSIAVCLLFGLVACGSGSSDSGEATSGTITSIRLSSHKIYPTIGSDTLLKLTALHDDGTSSDITNRANWSSNDRNIATVAAGKVSPISVGTTTVTAAFEGHKASAEVVINDAALTDIYIISATDSVMEGLDMPLKLMANYNNGRSVEVTDQIDWESNNTAIATIDQAGKVTGIAEGSVRITATFARRDATVEINVDRTTLTDTQLTIAKGYDDSIMEGESTQLRFTANYDNNTSPKVNGKVKWHVNDPTIATVDPEGKVTGHTEGVAIITAQFEEAPKESIEVTVVAPEIMQLRLSYESNAIIEGNMRSLELIADRVDETSKNVTDDAKWHSSDDTVVEVVNGKITAHSKGSATITAQFAEHSAEEVTIHVMPAELAYLKLTGTSDVLVNQSTPLTLTAHYDNGGDGEVDPLSAIWTSDNPAAATVNQKGEVTGRAMDVGPATITASFGGLEETFVVEVLDTQQITSIELSSKHINVLDDSKIGAQLILIAQFSNGSDPLDITNHPATGWKAIDDDTATVVEGFVIGIDEGDTTIEAYFDGELVEEASVTVIPAADAATITLSLNDPYSDDAQITIRDVTNTVGLCDPDLEVTCNLSVAPGSQVTLVALPDFIADFKGWEGVVCDNPEAEKECVVTVGDRNSNMDAYAVFETPMKTIAIDIWFTFGGYTDLTKTYIHLPEIEWRTDKVGGGKHICGNAQKCNIEVPERIGKLTFAVKNTEPYALFYEWVDSSCEESSWSYSCTVDPSADEPINITADIWPNVG